jgi:hypothetical protein
LFWLTSPLSESGQQPATVINDRCQLLGKATTAAAESSPLFGFRRRCPANRQQPATVINGDGTLGKATTPPSWYASPVWIAPLSGKAGSSQRQ